MKDRSRHSYVLLVEDDEDDYVLVQDLLRKVPQSGYRLEWVPSVEAGLRAIRRNCHDICLLDYRIGERTCFDFLRETAKQHFETPIVLLSAQGDYEVDLEAMKAGAVDFISKSDLTADLLERTIRYAMKRRRVEGELRAYAARQERMNLELSYALERLQKAEEELREQNRQLIAAEATRRSEALLQKVLNALPIGVWIADGDGRIISNNPAGELLWENVKYVCTEGDSQCIASWLHTKKPIEQKDWALARAILMGETSLNEELEIESRDGVRRTILSSAIPIWDEQSNVSGAISVAQDISSQKRAERQIRYLTHALMKGQESERQKVSYDLHDVIGQNLSALKIKMDSIQDEPVEDASTLRLKVPELSSMLQESITALRELSYTLRPASLDELGLARTLERYCEEFARGNGMRIELLTAGADDVKLGYNTSIALYRLVQESLANVVKHAAASTVAIKLVASFPNIVLSVLDDGRGFDVKDRFLSTSKETCMGLRSMEERVALLGGTMRIKSSPMQGTLVRFEVPQESWDAQEQEGFDHRRSPSFP